MSTGKFKRELNQLIESMGMKVVSVEKGRHYKYRLTHPSWGDQSKMLVVSISTSDYRAMLNIRSNLRSML